MSVINTNTTGEWDLVNISRDNVVKDMIEHVQIMSTEAGRSDWSVLIVDEWTLRIIGSFMRTYDVTEHNIIVIENLSMKRQPLPDFPGIYFVRPTPEAVARIVEDFAGEKPIYQSAHIYFTSPVPDDGGALLGQLARVRPYVKSLYEANVDYLPVEQRAFHLGMGDSLRDLYSPRAAAEGARDAAIKTAVERVATFCLTFGEYPLIRYENASSVAKEIATQLKTVLDGLAGRGRVAVRSDRRRSEFVITGRSVDVCAPVLSEFTYQAMVQHLLTLTGNNHNKYTFTYNGKPREAVLDEKDALWTRLRHRHIAEASGEITEEFNDFMAKNRISSSSGARGAQSFKELSELAKGLTKYADLMAKYSLHIDLADKAFAAFNARKLADLAAVEQDFATGYTNAGDQIKEAEYRQRILALLEDPNILKEDKIRLIMVWDIHEKGLNESFLDRMITAAQLTPEEAAAVKSLSCLGITAGADANNTKKSMKKKFLSLFHDSKNEDDEEAARRKKLSADDVSYELSRYIPQTKYVFSQLIDCTLSEADFPYVPGAAAASDAAAAGANDDDFVVVGKEGIAAAAASSKKSFFKGSGLSLSIGGSSSSSSKEPEEQITTASSSSSYIRDLIGIKTSDEDDEGKKKEKHVPKWAHKPVEVGRFSESDFSNDDPRFVIFMAGGMTYSEMRTAYEISDKEGKNCYIGATEILTPQAFVEELKKF